MKKKKQLWLAFYVNGIEKLAYTIEGTFPGERLATINLLASEYKCDTSNITTKIIKR